MTYAGTAAEFIASLKAAMDAVIAAELRFGWPILRNIAVIFVGWRFILLMTGDLDAMRFLRSSVRVLVVAYLVGQSPHYVASIRDPVFDLPQTLQSAVLGGVGAGGVSGSATPAEQFDKAAAAAEAVTGKIQGRSTGWSVASFLNYGGATLSNNWFQSMLSVIFALYMIGQTLLAVVLCFGPLVLLFELFERTRGWVDQWLGKIVGVVAYGLGTAILLAFMMMHLHGLLDALDSNMPTGGGEAVARFGRVIGWAVFDVIVMPALPAVCAFGAGGITGAMAPSMMAVARGGLSALNSAAPRAAPRTGGSTPGRPATPHTGGGAPGRPANTATRA